MKFCETQKRLPVSKVYIDCVTHIYFLLTALSGFNEGYDTSKQASANPEKSAQ